MISVTSVVVILLVVVPVVFTTAWLWGRRAQRIDTMRMLFGLLELPMYERPYSLANLPPPDGRPGPTLTDILNGVAVCVHQRYDKRVAARKGTDRR